MSLERSELLENTSSTIGAGRKKSRDNLEIELDEHKTVSQDRTGNEDKLGACIIRSKIATLLF